MKYLLTVFAVLFLFAIALYFALKKVFDMTFAPKRDHSDNFRYVPDTPQYTTIADVMLEHTDKLAKESFEEIYIKSHDGLKLFGRYYKRDRTDIVKLDFHGYRSHAYRDFSGNNEINKVLGLSSILVDQRSHGKSDGKAICFGVKERFDVLSWVNYTTEHFGKDTKIILSGVSMGASTVLMASELDLPENVVGIIADCPYSSPRDIILKVAHDRKLNGKLLFPLVKLSAKIFAKTDIDASSPADAVKNTNIPILIIHGDDDRFVPFNMGRKIFEACASKNKRFLGVEGAGHALSYYCNPQGYMNTVKEFIESVI